MQLSMEKIKILQARRQMTQKEVSEVSGISRTTLHRAMCGYECNPVIAGKIAQALEVDITEILEEISAKKEQSR